MNQQVRPDDIDELLVRDMCRGKSQLPIEIVIIQPPGSTLRRAGRGTRSHARAEDHPTIP